MKQDLKALLEQLDHETLTEEATQLLANVNRNHGMGLEVMGLGSQDAVAEYTSKEENLSIPIEQLPALKEAVEFGYYIGIESL